MVVPWAVEEMAGVDLQDKRLNKRLTQVLSDLGERPTASIPAASGGRAEMAGAYRLFDNEKATCARILDPHAAKTCERVRAQKAVLAVQDTSEMELTRPQQQVAGAGPLATEARQGIFLHLVEAFTPDGTPLGQVWSQTWPNGGRAAAVAGRQAQTASGSTDRGQGEQALAGGLARDARVGGAMSGGDLRQRGRQRSRHL